MKLNITEEWLKSKLNEADDPCGLIACSPELYGKLFKKENAMHYRNGREAKNGDTIIQIGFDGKINALGVLYNATVGNDFCNGFIAPIQPIVAGACMCDCLHVDDVMEMLAAKGLDKRPDGK